MLRIQNRDRDAYLRPDSKPGQDRDISNLVPSSPLDWFVPEQGAGWGRREGDGSEGAGRGLVEESLLRPQLLVLLCTCLLSNPALYNYKILLTQLA
ncbi:hypothetical protein Cni_G28750 [Canna indica]|uniref:Uncharacterized protein n=1 Tax=Canna indica TaxID=4628 RepID=A0AAQ3QSS1_9LILI|nr:hypothetical protein Cni_G28750 [Canna indica]